MLSSLFKAARTRKNLKSYAVKGCIYVNDVPTQEVHLNIPAFSKKQAKEKFDNAVELRVVGAIQNKKK